MPGGADAEPLDAVAAALGTLAGALTQERHPFVCKRQAVIALNAELQEREALSVTTLPAP